MTRYLVTDQQLRYAIYSAIRALDISKQDENYIIESTAKVSDKALELLPHRRPPNRNKPRIPNRLLAVKSIRASTHLSN